MTNTDSIPNNTPAQNDITLESYDPLTLMELQTAFGMLIQDKPNLVHLVNNTAPVLFATLLFTACSDFRISDDGESVEANNSALESESKAIGIIRSVSQAFGALDDSITVEPSDAEVDQDTDLVAVS